MELTQKIDIVYFLVDVRVAARHVVLEDQRLSRALWGDFKLFGGNSDVI
jgi:hypothetical protein